MTKASRRDSQKLSWLLRHGANEAGLAMDAAGWSEIADVLRILDMGAEGLRSAVEHNDKDRLELDGSRIRACQGHSLEGMPVTQEALEFTWTAVTPNESLWHGTRVAAVDGIAAQGIVPAGRTHVHLAPTRTSRVGKRASVDVLLEISPRELAAQKVQVFRAPNGVLLVRRVPVAAIVGVEPGSLTDPMELGRLRDLLAT